MMDQQNQIAKAKEILSYEHAMEKVQQINSENIIKAKSGFTGSITVNWLNGVPKDIEVRQKKPIA